MDKATLDKLIHSFNEENLKSATQQLFADLQKGIPLKDAAHLTPELQEEIYAVAYDYYNQGKYPESSILFHLLSLVDPVSFRFLYGYASAHYKLKNFPEAILGFYTSMALQPLNPLPAYYLSDCLMQMGAPKDAENFLNITIDICNEAKNNEFSTIKERCKLLKKSLKK